MTSYLPPTRRLFHSRGPMDAKDMIDMPEQEFRRAVVERFNAQGAAIQENTTLTKTAAADTAFIATILTDVAAGARLLCRLAASWRFLIRQVFVPIGLPMLTLYVVVLAVSHRPVPEWALALFKLIG